MIKHIMLHKVEAVCSLLIATTVGVGTLTEAPKTYWECRKSQHTLIMSPATQKHVVLPISSVSETDRLNVHEKATVYCVSPSNSSIPRLAKKVTYE